MGHEMTWNWGMYVVWGLFAAIIAGAIFIIIDTMRPSRQKKYQALLDAKLARVPLMAYQIFSALYVLMFILTRIPFLNKYLSTIFVISALPMLIVVVAYLLNVVFPKSSEPTRRRRRDALQDTDFDDLDLDFLSSSYPNPKKEIETNDESR